jgi:ATP-binding cassette subfamily B protein
MLVGLAAQYLLPQMIRFVADSVIGNQPMEEIPIIAALVDWLGGVELFREKLYLAGLVTVAIAVTNAVFTFLYRRTLATGAEGIIRRLRDRLYSHIQALPYEWHVKIQTGDVIQRCTSDVDVVKNFVSNQLTEMARTIVLVTLAYSLLFPMNWRMALASILFLPVIFAYSFIFLQKVSDRFLKCDEAEGALLSIAQENLTGVRVVRAFGRERYETDRFDKQNRHYAGLWTHLGKLLSTFWGLGDFMTGIQMIVICAMGVYEAINGNLTVGGFMVFLTYNSMTIWPVRGLGRVLSEASKTGVSLKRLGEILDAEPETDSEHALDVPVEGDIVFENVSFSYENQPVLHDVSFTVKQGTTLGILGATGSGKTTVAHLLCRLYDLKEDGGMITIGGKDVREFRRDRLRKSIGIVLQEPFLYSRSIGENIAALADCHSHEAICKAAEIASVHGDIEGFPSQYKTIVGERGVTLSGGQKQRVAIARTILGNPAVMIFDDSLSAVDTETDARIRAGLAERTKDVTTIIIAHRIASIRSADQIIVLDEGRIVEMGTPDELMALNGTYRRIHDMQESVEEAVGN